MPTNMAASCAIVISVKETVCIKKKSTLLQFISHCTQIVSDITLSISGNSMSHL